MTFADGALRAKADAGRLDAYGNIVSRAGRASVEGHAKQKESASRDGFAHHAFGAQFAEVRVDEELGMIRVVRMLGVFACGKILNPRTARSQFLGGMVWGLGLALLERTERDPRTGRVVTKDLADYHVPTCADALAMEVLMIDERDDRVSDVGAKGIGEIGITGAAAAIANAVYHATGKRVRDLPIRLDALL
ncbi:MAG: molybdopterin cofactor-binding domain-containing protein [Polyangiaceae bacterium]